MNSVMMNYPLARLLGNNEFCDDEPLTQSITRRQEKWQFPIPTRLSVDFGQIHCIHTSENTGDVVL